MEFYLGFRAKELLTIPWLFVSLAAGILSWWAYNLYFHPLSRFPGPLLARLSWVDYSFSNRGGTLAEKTRRRHDEYGEVVRIAPNILSFNHPQAWEDIYGRGAGGGYGFIKDSGKELRLPDSPTSIGFVGEKDHRRYRGALSPAFSERAIMEHEPLAMKLVDSLLESLHKLADSPRRGFIDIEKSLTAVMFDISLELSFGESLNTVATPDRNHPWIELVKSSVKLVSVYTGMRRLVPRALWTSMNRLMLLGPAKSRLDAYSFAKQAFERRLKNTTAHKDFMAHMIESIGIQDGLSHGEVERLAFTLVNAGSDTTSTLLCHIVYRLAKHRDVLQELRQQVQDVAGTPSGVSFSSVKRMPYLTAVIEESLRVLPPVPNLFPRVVPRGGAEICGHFVPGGSIVTVSQLSMNLSSKNFIHATEFLPSRWLGGSRFQTDNRKARKPFGYGPRNCAGQNSAYMHSRVIIARLVLEFDMTLAPESVDWRENCKGYDIVLRSPLYVKLWPLQKNDDW